MRNKTRVFKRRCFANLRHIWLEFLDSINNMELLDMGLATSNVAINTFNLQEKKFPCVLREGMSVIFITFGTFVHISP